MSQFQVISKYKDAGISLPERKTEYSAGYDLAAAEDIIIPPLQKHMQSLYDYRLVNELDFPNPITLKELSKITKEKNIKPTLVPTGIKCQLEPDTYLQLSVRSSLSLKHWLILANGVGVIDADYYNNEDNEGHIYIQLINLSPFEIKINKGELIAQGIILPYNTTIDDNATNKRVGGFGSTSI